MKLKTQNGIGLVEMLLVICIIAVILVAVTLQVKRWMWEKDASQIQHSVELLKQATDLYYFQHCADMNALSGGMHTIKYDEVLLLLPENIRGAVRNPWARDDKKPFAVNVVVSNDKTVYQLLIKATLNQRPRTVRGLATTVDADYVSGQTIAWHFLPNHLPHAIDGNLWVLNSTNDLYSQNLLKAFDGDPAVNNYCR